jgi:potassium-dependent mechanosensitive channel
MRMFTHFLLIVLNLLILTPSVLADNPTAIDAERQAHRQWIEKTQIALKRQRLDREELQDALIKAVDIRTHSNQCVTRVEESRLQQKALLDQTPAAEIANPLPMPSLKLPTPPLAKSGVQEIQQQLILLESELVECRLLLQQSTQLVTQLNEAEQAALLVTLTQRDEDARQVVLQLWADLSNLPDFLQRLWHTQADPLVPTDMQTSSQSWWMLAGVLLISSVIAAFGFYWLRQHRPTIIPERFSSQVLVSVWHCLERYGAIGWISLSLGLAVEALLPNHTWLSYLGYAVALMALLLGSSAALLAPPLPATPLIDWPPAFALALYRRLRNFYSLLLIGGLIWISLQYWQWPESAEAMARLLGVCFGLLNFVSLVNLVRIISQTRRVVLLSLLVQIGLLLLMIAEMLGYLRLVNYVVTGLASSILLGVLIWLFNALTHQFFSELDQGKQPWVQRLKQSMQLEPTALFPGLLWLRLLSFITLFGIGIAALLNIWGFASSGGLIVRQYWLDGFAIGKLQIVPYQILIGIVLFTVLSSLFSWVSQRIDHASLFTERMDRNARETLVKLIGYLGFAIALLVGLSVAGFDFSNLAIIAGALSVGIGFGLQNIVNNFVSGIILLFERPIRRGDWVKVGNTEGIVKNIRVRSTEIQTWDRFDVIVPNSAFISSEVTNLTLNDSFGRIIVSLKVAQDSNTQQIKTLLLKVAEDNANVFPKANPYGVPGPVVLFKSFGDTALEFELRCFVREIRDRLSVISELNFAIELALRANSIQMSFPQREVVVRTQDDPFKPLPPKTSATTGTDGSALNPEPRLKNAD